MNLWCPLATDLAAEELREQHTPPPRVLFLPTRRKRAANEAACSLSKKLPLRSRKAERNDVWTRSSEKQGDSWRVGEVVGTSGCGGEVRDCWRCWRRRVWGGWCEVMLFPASAILQAACGTKPPRSVHCHLTHLLDQRQTRPATGRLRNKKRDKIRERNAMKLTLFLSRTAMFELNQIN